MKEFDALITDVCDIVLSHFSSGWFEPYITYCSNEVYQQRVLQELLSNNAGFRKAVKAGEKNKNCGGLPLHSFLLLPLQRITRLPLLMDVSCYSTHIWSHGAKRMFRRYDKSATFNLRYISSRLKPCAKHLVW